MKAGVNLERRNTLKTGGGLGLLAGCRPDPARSRATAKGGITGVRVLMQREMKNGWRKDEAGNLIPAWYITEIKAHHNDKIVLDGRFGTAGSKTLFNLTGMAMMPPPIMKPAMPVPPIPTFPRKRGKGRTRVDGWWRRALPNLPPQAGEGANESLREFHVKYLSRWVCRCEFICTLNELCANTHRVQEPLRGKFAPTRTA